MNNFARRKPMRPQHGNVSTHAVTMFFAMSQFTWRTLLEAPTPMMAEVEQCDVEIMVPRTRLLAYNLFLSERDL